MLGAGDHVPLTPSKEVVGNVKESFLQIGAIVAKVGTVGIVLTVTVMFVFNAHCPELGVKV